jgi:hypothetical protein
VVREEKIRQKVGWESLEKGKVTENRTGYVKKKIKIGRKYEGKFMRK